MDLKKLANALDAKVIAGDIVGAFDAFAADHCITFSSPQDITRSKTQKLEALRWFMDNIAHINKIERPAVEVVGENETRSEFSFDFTNKQGESLVYNETIRRVWENGKLVEEEYLLGQTIQPAQPAKKTKASSQEKESATKTTTRKTKTVETAPEAAPAKKPRSKKQ